MAIKKKIVAKKTAAVKKSKKRSPAPALAGRASDSNIPEQLRTFLAQTSIPKGFVNTKKLSLVDFRKRLNEMKLRPTVGTAQLLASVNRIKPALAPLNRLPEEVQSSIRALKPVARRFHGAKLELSWFPFPTVTSTCADKFGYMSSAATRTASALPFNVSTQALLGQLGNLMADPGRVPNAASHNPADAGVSTIPAGFTYFGQFVDHDITLDVSSSLDAATDATTINNMRSPTLDLDSVYGRGPGLDPYLYSFPSSGPGTAIKLLTGTNRNSGSGGPSSNGTPGGMVPQATFDVPRMLSTNTAVIGDPRNDENLLVAQFHHAMLRFHNAVVDLLLSAEFAGDVFAEAKRIVTHHYQWAVVHDFLPRLVGADLVDQVLTEGGRWFAPEPAQAYIPLEFADAAFRYGHGQIRHTYRLVDGGPALPLFPDLVGFGPLPADRRLDLAQIFDVPGRAPAQRAKRLDGRLAASLIGLPEQVTGAVDTEAYRSLAVRDLLRGETTGLPSGEAIARLVGAAPLTPDELDKSWPDGTPLWYYILKEAEYRGGGDRLGPVGGRIVTEVLIGLLRADPASYLSREPSFQGSGLADLLTGNPQPG